MLKLPVKIDFTRQRVNVECLYTRRFADAMGFYVMHAERKRGQQFGGLALGSSKIFAHAMLRLIQVKSREKRQKNSFHTSMRKRQNFIYTSFCRCHGVLRDA